MTSRSDVELVRERRTGSFLQYSKSAFIPSIKLHTTATKATTLMGRHRPTLELASVRLRWFRQLLLRCHEVQRFDVRRVRVESGGFARRGLAHEANERVTAHVHGKGGNWDGTQENDAGLNLLDRGRRSPKDSAWWRLERSFEAIGCSPAEESIIRVM